MEECRLPSPSLSRSQDGLLRVWAAVMLLFGRQASFSPRGPAMIPAPLMQTRHWRCPLCHLSVNLRSVRFGVPGIKDTIERLSHGQTSGQAAG
jgi:hypothetical protein